MVDIVLHAGTGHVNLWLVLFPALAAFVGGLGLGWWSRRSKRERSERDDETSPMSE